MGFPYQIDPARALVTITYQDPVTFDRWRQTMEQIFADPTYQSGLNVLGDRRAAHKAPSVSYVESVVDFLAAHGPRFEGARWANVVPPGDLAMFGMGRMVDLMTDSRIPLTVRTFDDYDAAVAWLAEPRA